MKNTKCYHKGNRSVLTTKKKPTTDEHDYNPKYILLIIKEHTQLHELNKNPKNK